MASFIDADLVEHGIDYAEALERFSGNEELYARLAAKYLNDPHYEGLRESLAQRDQQTAYKHAHALKGVAGNLSFFALYRTSGDISDALHVGDFATAEALMPQLEAAHSAVVSALERVRV